MNNDQLFDSVQKFLAEQKPLLDELANNAQEFMEQYPIEHWVQDPDEANGRIMSRNWLVLRGYLDYRLKGELEHRLTFSGFGITFGEDDQ